MSESSLRVGVGYDAHRFSKSKSRPLFLGGVRVPHSKGLEGHSDADVILHAIVDSLLGAAGLPDIGAYFSNRDPRWRNVSSLVFLREVSRILSRKKIRIVNVDCVLIADAPKIAPYIKEMKERTADALKIKSSAVGIKASTNEGMGFIGRGEGMAASACSLIDMRGA